MNNRVLDLNFNCSQFLINIPKKLYKNLTDYIKKGHCDVTELLTGVK